MLQLPLVRVRARAVDKSCWIRLRHVPAYRKARFVCSTNCAAPVGADESQNGCRLVMLGPRMLVSTRTGS